MIDYYNLLGVEADASPGAIRAAFRAQAKRHHPDAQPLLSGTQKEQAQRHFIQLAQAYQTLIDPARRREYDRKRLAGSMPRGAASRRAEPKPRMGPQPARAAASVKGGGVGGHGRKGASAGEEAVSLDDLLHDVEELLSGFGIDLKQPMESLFEDLLDWARRIFEQAVGAWISAERQRSRRGRAGSGAASQAGPTRERPPSSPRPRRPAPSRPPPSSRASGESVERELAEIKRRVRAGMRASRPPGGAPGSVEEELRRLRARKGKGD